MVERWCPKEALTVKLAGTDGMQAAEANQAAPALVGRSPPDG